MKESTPSSEKDPQALRKYLGGLSDDKLDYILRNSLVALTGEYKVPATIPFSIEEVDKVAEEILRERKINERV